MFWKLIKPLSGGNAKCRSCKPRDNAFHLLLFTAPNIYTEISEIKNNSCSVHPEESLGTVLSVHGCVYQLELESGARHLQ